MTRSPTWSDFEPSYLDLEARELSLSNVDTWLHDWSELEKEVEEQLAVLQRAKDEDTRDEAAETAFMTFVQEVGPPVETASQHLKLKLLNLEGYKPSSKTTEFFKRFRNEADLFRDANASLLAEEATLSSEYSRLMGGLTVDLDSETLTIPEARKKFLEPDRDLRERTWRAVQEAELSVSSELDELFLKLLKLRQQIAKNAELDNYRSFAWRQWNRFDYTPEESLALHESIASEVVPLVAKLRKERQQEMKLPTLRPWDVSVDPQARAPLEPFKTVRELEEGLIRIFNRLDPELAAQFNSLRNGWLDLESREGKVPGLGYQSFFPKQQKPYIYHSVNRTHSDVTTLVHEAGHAFHSLASVNQNDLTWNFYPGTEFMEVASQAMELLTLPYLSEAEGGFYTEEDAQRAQREGLERVLVLFPYIAKSDAFQHWLYTEAPKDVGIAELDAKWLELEERFDPGVDWSGLESERAKGWHYFHIFVVPFYMLEYAYAWLGAAQIWQNALEDPQTALTKYRAALALGGTKPLPELFAAAGARLAFDRETVGELMRFVYHQR